MLEVLVLILSGRNDRAEYRSNSPGAPCQSLRPSLVAYTSVVIPITVNIGIMTSSSPPSSDSGYSFSVICPQREHKPLRAKYIDDISDKGVDITMIRVAAVATRPCSEVAVGFEANVAAFWLRCHVDGRVGIVRNGIERVPAWLEGMLVKVVGRAQVRDPRGLTHMRPKFLRTKT